MLSKLPSGPGREAVRGLHWVMGSPPLVRSGLADSRVCSREWRSGLLVSRCFTLVRYLSHTCKVPSPCGPQIFTGLTLQKWQPLGQRGRPQDLLKGRKPGVTADKPKGRVKLAVDI